MVHKLAIVAFSGLVISAVAMGAAAAIGAREFGANFEGMDFSNWGGDRPRCERVAGDTSGRTASNGSRTLNWDGSDHVSLNVPATARYVPNGSKQWHISGDPDVVAHVRVRDGRIELNCRGRWSDDALQITLPGTRMEKFSIAGSGKLELENLDQQDLKVSIAGSGSIKASGKVKDLEVAIAGSGDVDMGRVASEDVSVRIAGSGNADIAPRGEAKIRIAGSGDVNVHSNPRNVETRIAGSGRIHNVATSGDNI
jgi:hypothetical protein